MVHGVTRKSSGGKQLTFRYGFSRFLAVTLANYLISLTGLAICEMGLLTGPGSELMSRSECNTIKLLAWHLANRLGA